MALSLRVLRHISKKKYKKSLQMIPFFFTFGNAFFGFLAVVQAISGHLVLAAYCIGLAAFMDAFDGRLARRLGCSSSFGAELDALCDAVSFCFAPAVLLFVFYDFSMNAVSISMLAVYLCAGLFRLAKFNTNTHTNISYFSGLPTTVAAFFLASLLVYHEWIELSYMKFLIQPRGVLLVLALLSLLMISAIPFPSFKAYRITFPRSYVALSVSLAGVCVCIMRGYPVLFIALGSYIALSCLHWIIMRAKHWLT